MRRGRFPCFNITARVIDRSNAQIAVNLAARVYVKKKTSYGR